MSVTPNFIPQPAQVQQPVQAAVQPQQAMQPVAGNGFVNPFVQIQQQAMPQQQAFQAPVAQQNDDPFAPKPFTIGDSSVGITHPNTLAGQPQQQFAQPQFGQQQQFPMQNPYLNGQMPGNGMQNPAAMPGFGMTQNPQESMLAEFLKTQQATSQQTQELIQKLVETQNRPTSNTPDYLSMDSSELLELINGDPDSGKPSKIKDILESIQTKAATDATSRFEQEIQKQGKMLEAIQMQHIRSQTANEISHLKQKYGQSDPFFQQNMMQLAELAGTPAGAAMLDADPLPGYSKFETAYLLQQARQMQSPQYQQAIQMQQQMMQQQQLAQKLQAGMPAQAGMNQHVTPYPTMQQQIQPNQQQSDAALVAQILNAGGDMLGVPNVRMAV